MAGSMVLGRRDPAEVAPAPEDKVRVFIDETGALALIDEAGNVVTPQEVLEGKLSAAANLSDLGSAATARTNLGLGSAATEPKAAFDAAGVAAAEALTEKVAREAADLSIGRRLLRILTEGLQDATVLFAGDSVSAAYSTYVGGVVDGLAARFPAVTVKYGDWTNGNPDYNALSTKQVGTGPRTLTVYNCAVASQNAYYQMAPYFDTMIASKQPDLIFFNHGHNHGPSSATALETWSNALTVITQSILRACPSAEIVLMAQNPRTDASATIQAERQHSVERIAHLSGFGFINVHRLFLDADPSAASLLADTVHPNAAGHTLIANKVLSLLRLDGPLGSEQRSALDLTTPVNGLLNGDFAAFAVPPTLTSWTATNLTLTKDEVNFESPNGYAVKVATTAGGTNAFLAQSIGAAAQRRFRGEWATFLARVRIPSGQLAQAGRLELVENNGSHAGVSYSRTLLGGQGDYRWEMVSRRIAKDCTSITSRIFCSEGAGTGEVSIDRAILVPGIWPRDIR